MPHDNIALKSALHGQTTVSVHRVLMATDFSPSARLVLGYAAVFAKRLGAHLTVLHTFEYGPYGKTVEIVDGVSCRERREAESRTQAFVADLEKLGVAAGWCVEEGSVKSTVLKTLDSLHADLLVIGTQGIHRGADHLLVGSNTEALMLGAPCPVLTVGPHLQKGIAPEGGFQRILLVTDLTPSSAKVAAFTISLALDFEATVEIFHLSAPNGGRDPQKVREQIAGYCEALAALQIKLPKEWHDVEFQLSCLTSPEKLFERATDTEALMVIGAHRTGILSRHLHTSVAYRLLAEAVCPILTVPCDGC